MPNLFKHAFQSAAIGMAIVARDGRFLRVNRAFCRIVGYSEDEMRSLTFQDITYPDDLEADLAYVGQMIRGEIESYEMEKRYIHKEGQHVWVLLSVSMSPPEDDNSGCFFAQVQDITRRKDAESCLKVSIEAKQRLYEELRQATESVAKLQEGLVTICAWSKQIRFGEEWKTIEGFLTEHLHLKLSHGMSEEVAAQMRAELEAKLKSRNNSALNRE